MTGLFSVNALWGIIVGTFMSTFLIVLIVYLVIMSREKILVVDKIRNEENRNHNLKFYDMFNRINDVVFMLSLEGVILHVNETVYRQLGYTVSELTNTQLKDIVHKKHHQAIDRWLKDAKRKNGKSHAEVILKSKEGGDRMFEFHNTTSIPWKTEAGINCFARNITEVKITKQAYQEIEMCFNQLLLYTPTPMVIIEEKGIIVNANSPSGKLFTGGVDKSVVGDSIYSFVDDCFENRLREKMPNIFEHGIESSIFKGKICNKRDSACDIEVREVPVKYNSAPALMLIFDDSGRA